MPSFVKKRSSKAGLPPGTLVHIGEKKTDEVRMTLIEYNRDTWSEEEMTSVAAGASGRKSRPGRQSRTVSWLNIGGVHRLDFIEQVGKAFKLHPLVLEDIVNTDQRPKMDDYGEYLYVVLKMVYAGAHPQEIHVEQVSLIQGRNFVLSFQENGSDVFGPVRNRLKTGKGRSRTLGADYLMYALVDAIVDHYFAILEVLGERIEKLENAIVANPRPALLGDIHDLKREMLLLRRCVWPVREVISGLQRAESRLIADDTRTYLKDVYDHAVQVVETLEIFREMVTEILDVYLSGISNRMTGVMTALTIIATIFMPLTFIVGVYGMNFQYMPELEWRWGYPMVLAGMAAIAAGMLVFIKKRKWLS